MAYKKEKKRNTPIAQLIKQFRDKKSGKVVESREEIQKRFDYLDWKDQKAILLAFLDSTKTDRSWAYSKVLDYWDDSFIPIVKVLWEQEHEEKCKWVVIRHFPLEYLKDKQHEFNGDRDYFFLCMRFAEDSQYEIDKNRITCTDYLAVIYHTGRVITEVEAKDVLYNCIHDVCLDRYYIELDKNVKVAGMGLICVDSLRDVSLALYYLRMMDFISITKQFSEWINKVRTDIAMSQERLDVSYMDLSDYERLQRGIAIAKKYAYLALDKKYKKASDPDIESILTPKELFTYEYQTLWQEEEPILPF